MAHPLLWEFPGGKVEPGEHEADCLRREILEELDLRVEVLERLTEQPYTYPGGRPLVLIPFRCRIEGGTPRALQHDEIRWVRPEELSGLDWAAADVPVWQDYLARCSVSRS
jgi:8-oxo-dGTP diphosphatase